MTDQFHVCNHQQSDGLAEGKDLTAESFEAELQDVKENVRNLNLGLHSVVKRVERLEGAHFDLVDRQRQSLRNKHVSIASSEPMELGTSVDEVAHNKRPASEISTGTAAPPARRVFKSTSYQKVDGDDNPKLATLTPLKIVYFRRFTHRDQHTMAPCPNPFLSALPRVIRFWMIFVWSRSIALLP